MLPKAFVFVKSHLSTRKGNAIVDIMRTPSRLAILESARRNRYDRCLCRVQASCNRPARQFGEIASFSTLHESGQDGGVAGVSDG